MPQEPSVWDRLKKLFGKNPNGGAKPSPGPPTVKESVPALRVSPPPQDNAAPVSATDPAAEAISQSARPAARPGSPAPFSPSVGTGPAIHLVLGVDFGTSCTKVVIGDPAWQNKAFPVPFSEPHSELRSWLHATKLGTEANLKMRLMENPKSASIRDLAACYLATVIQHARTWFEQHAPTDYKRGRWTWSLNLGFPGKTVQDGEPVAEAYRQVALAALKMVPHTPKSDLTQELPAGIGDGDDFIPASRVRLYPEIAAQLAGYIRSPYRQHGNLLLVDVGAGTLDVSTLIIHATGDEEVVSFHVCDVKALGVLHLYKARADALNNVSRGCVARGVETFQDGCTAVPDTTGEMLNASFALPTPPLKQAFDLATEHFKSEVLGTVLPCLTRFRILQRAAHENTGFDPWPEHLRFFLTGGGSRADFYREQFIEGPLEEQLVRFTRWCHDPAQRVRNGQGLRLDTMPTPRNLVGFPISLTEHFDRLSVAYGLAQGAENLPRITGTSNC